MTRLNVYAGPAGFYLIRGGPAGDDEVLEPREECAVLEGVRHERVDVLFEGQLDANAHG